jgi:hypothetical protein
MKAVGFILGVSIVVMAPALAPAQGRTPQTPQIAPMGPTLMLPPGAAPQITPMGSTQRPVPPAVNVQPSPQTVCQTHLESICNVDNFLPQRAGHGVQPIADRVFFVIGPLPSP